MPFPPNIRRSYIGVTVTLTTANQRYGLLALIQAAVAAQNPPSEAPAACRELNIQSNPGIDGTGANTNDVLIGDGFLTTANVAYVLPVGSSRTYRSGSSGNVPIGTIFVQSAGAGQKLNVELEMA